MSKPLLRAVWEAGGWQDESNLGTGMAFLERGEWFSVMGLSIFSCRGAFLPLGSFSSGLLLSVFMKSGLLTFFLNFKSKS